MSRDNKVLNKDELDEADMNLSLDEISSSKGKKSIERFKTKFARNIQSIDDQIKRDMDFWLKYRPYRWLSFIPKRLEKLILQFIDRKDPKRLVFYITLIFGLVFVGLVPTLKFLFWYLFKIWLICILIPLAYWGLAIISIYSRVVSIILLKFILNILDKVILR